MSHYALGIFCLSLIDILLMLIFIFVVWWRFCLFLLFCFCLCFEREGIKLGGFRGEEDLGGIEVWENTIKIYCMEKNLTKV